MKKAISSMLCAIYLFVPTAIQAEQIMGNYEITELGPQLHQSESIAFVRVNSPQIASCQWQYLYIADMNNKTNAQMYSTLLAVKLSGTTIKRIDYAPRASDGLCIISLIML